MAEASVIELRAGTGEPRQISLTPGSVLDPTSVGQTGMWRVQGGGVLDVHGYIYFDGKALFVQSADDAAPVMVNRHRVARAWTEVRMPSTIELGQVQLVYRIDTAGFEDADQTTNNPIEDQYEPKTAKFDPNKHRMPAPRVQSPRPAAGTPAEGVPTAAKRGGGGEFGTRKDESTRYQPIDKMIPPDRASQPAIIPSGFGPPGTADPTADATRMQKVERPSSPAFGPTMMGQSQGQPSPAAYAPPGVLPPGMMGMGQQPGMQGMPGMQGAPPGMQGAPMGYMQQPGQGAPSQQGWGGSVTGPAQAGQAQTQASGSSPLQKLRHEFNAFSPVKRLTVVLLIFAVPVGGFALLAGDDEPATPPQKTASVDPTAPPAMSAPPPQALNMQAGTTGATPLASGVTGGAGAGAAQTLGPQGNTTPTVQATASASASAKGKPQPPPPPKAPEAPAAPAGSGVKTPGELPPLMTTVPMPPQKSLERQAADAVAEGQFDVAAKIYDQLAAQNPNELKFKEAARILRGTR